jgi:hypothetical protein
MNNTPLEFDECLVLVDYLDVLERQGKIVKFTHIPNETYTESRNARRKNVQMHVAKGIPDFLIVGKNWLLFLEMKRVKGGVVSKEQAEWISVLQSESLRDVGAFVCKGFQEAKEIIDELL